MPWIRLDDQIALHRKFIAAGPIAAWLWVCGQSYCARYLTDGFIPQELLPSLGITDAALKTLGYRGTVKRHAEMLVAAGLWDEAPGGYQVHDYHVYQPTKEEVERRRENRRESGRIGGQRSVDSRKQAAVKQVAKQDGCIPASTEFNPDPSRPVPEESVTKNVTLSRRAILHERRNGRIQNDGDPMPLWDWQFAKFRDALKPKFGENAYVETLAWMHRVGDELLASGKPVDVSDPVKWWDARYAADWGGAGDDLAAFRALGRTAS